MVAEDGYVLAFNTVWPEVEDGKKYILTYKKKYILTYKAEAINNFDDEDELNRLS